MNTDEGNIWFGVGVNTADLENGLSRAKQAFSNLNDAVMQDFNRIDSEISAVAKSASQNSDTISKAMGESGAASAFTALGEAVTRTAEDMKGLPFETTQDKIATLSNAIRSNEEILASNTAALQNMKEKAQAAFNSGDMDGFKSISKDITEQVSNLQNLSRETEQYKVALQSVFSMEGMQGTAANVPKLYDSEADIQHVEQLKQEINSLQAEIVRVGSNGGNTTALTSQLSSLKDELNGCELKATQTAAALGPELGGRAAEAQQQLYLLNNAITEQESVISKLHSALQQAKSKYDELRASETATTEEVEMAGTAYNQLSAQLSQAQGQLAGMQAAQHEAQSNMRSVTEEIGVHDSVLVKMLGGYDNYTAILRQLPQPLQMAVQGITGMTGAARAFIATPLGAVIAAIILAVKALTTWFKSSADGQMAFAKISGYVSGVLSQLKEIVITVGRAIYNAFSNPKKAVSDLWQAIKTNIVNRFKALGDLATATGRIISAAFNFDWDGVKDGFKDIANAQAKLITGVDDVIGKTEKWINKAKDVAKANAELNVRERKLAGNRSRWQNEEAKLDKEISEQRLKMYKGTDAERLKATQRAEELINKKYAKRLEFAREEYNIIKKRNSLHSTTAEDLGKENAALANITKIEAEQNKAKTLFVRRGSGLESRIQKNTTGDTGETTEERRAKIQKAELDVQKVLEESSKARQELQRELSQQEEQNEINLEEDANKRRIRQLELDQAKEQDQLKKQQEQAVNAEIQRQKQLFDAQENERAAKNKEYTKKNFTEADIDQTQIDAITDKYQKLFDQLAKQQQKSRADLARGDFEAMRDYLKNYGTYQQQKLAIAQEYAKKIQDATSEGEKRSLERERDSKLANVETQALKANIDWTTVFGEFGGMFRDVIAPVLDDAKKYIQTDEFKNSDQDSQKALIQAIQQMEEAMGSTGEANFKQLGEDIKAYQAAQNKLKAAQQDNAAKTDNLTKAQDAYTKSLENGTEEEQAVAKKRVDTAQKEVDASNDNVQGLQENVDMAKQAVTDTATTLKASIDNTIGGLQQLSSNSLSGTYKGLIQFGKGLDAMKDMGKVGDTFGKLSKSLESVPIVGAIAGILDILKDGISDLISGLIDTIFSAVSNILDDVLSGNLVKSIGESLLTGINNIFDAITFGGFGSWLGNGDSDKNLQRDIERLTEVNSALANAIEELTDAMEDSAMVDAADLYQQQVKLLEESEANTQEMMRRSGAAHSNGTLGIGGHKSSNKKINKGVSNTEWERISSIVGFDVKSAADFWRLTSEQMRDVAVQAPDIYGKIKDLADNGYRDAAQYMDDYIDFAKQREELEEAYYEKLTSLSFDSLCDEFKNALTDMESSAADFAKDFNKLLIDSIAEALISNVYKDKIKALYEKWATYMEDDDVRGLDEEEIAELKADRDAIYASMADDRKWLQTLFPSATSQESSKKGFATASQDSIDELNGRFTAVQMDTSAIRETLNNINASMAAMNLSASATRQYQDEIRNISLMALDHLENIAKNTHELYEMNERLGKIEKNTRRI